MNINKILTESDNKNIDVKSQLKHHIQVQETKESECIFGKINSMRISFHKTDELNGSGFFKFPLRWSAIVSFEKNDKYWSIWSILAHLHPCEEIHPTRVKKYRQNFYHLNNQGFDFSNGFKCSDLQKFEILNNLSINIFELKIYQDQNKWKHNLNPIEISKNE